jgi:hypothetical protein
MAQAAKLVVGNGFIYFLIFVLLNRICGFFEYQKHDVKPLPVVKEKVGQLRKHVLKYNKFHKNCHK